MNGPVLRSNHAPLFLVLGTLLFAPALRAQDVRDLVREHLDERLEKPRKKKPAAHEVQTRSSALSDSEPAAPTEPAQEPAVAPEPPAPPQPEAAPASSPPAPAEPAPPPPPAEGAGFHLQLGGAETHEPPSDLPRRIMEKWLKLDVTAGAGYRGWRPQQYTNVPVKVGTYYVWTVEVKAKLFRALNLHRGYFESNALTPPSRDEAAVAVEVGSYVPKAAWILGVLGFPILKVWEPIIRYEARTFQTSARPTEPVCVVTDKNSQDLSQCERSRDRLNVRSGFETLVFAVRYDASKTQSAVLEPRGTNRTPPITFGVGLMSYRKPYQVNVAGDALEGYLFDGRFRGAGLMLGLDLPGGPDRIFVRADGQVGLGQVKLTQKLTLNELAPEDWKMGYVQGNVNVGFNLPLYRGVPTLMFVPQGTLGGASFFLFDTHKEADQAKSASSVNWDVLWSAHAALTLSL